MAARAAITAAVPADAGPAPELAFAVERVAPLDRAAVPTLAFTLRIDVTGPAPIRAVLLDTQVQIAARRRAYDQQAEERLFEIFGEPARWSTTLRTFPWTRHTQVVPAFSESTRIELPVPCTYDFDVLASRYLAALGDGEVPLELMFSGTVFYADGAGRFQAARIAWDREAECRLPVSVWRETMERYFPDTAWLRLRRGSFERLHAYKSRHALASWEAAIEKLLSEGDR